MTKIPLLLILLFFIFPLFCEESYHDDEYFFEDDIGITIVGTWQESGVLSSQMAVIEKEDIESRGSSDLANLLQDALNLNINRYGAYGNQTGISLRGFDSKRVAFLIDGVPANSAMDGKFDIYQIDLNSVERIEVISGGSDSKFNVSGALGGVINIITVKKQEPGWRFGASVSNTSALPGEYRDRSGKTQAAHWEDLADAQNYTFSAAYGRGAVSGKRGFSFSANAFANRAANHFLFKDNFLEETRRKDNNEVWDTGINGSAVWNLPGMTKLITSTKSYYGDKNISDFGSAGKQKDFSASQSLLLDAPRAFHDNIAAEASLAWNFARMDYTQPSNAFSRHDQHSLNAISRWNWYPGEKLTLRSGLDYQFISLGSTEIGSRSRHNGGIYLTAELNPVRQFHIIPSVKAVFSSGKSANAVIVPKLGFLWQITETFALKNNYFRSFKYPDFEELYWSQPGFYSNPDLLPEDGWGGDLGTVWDIHKLIKMESVFFTQWIKNSIHWYEDSSRIWRSENVGEAVFIGLDTNLNFEIPLSRGPFNKISASLSYKYLRSYLLSFGYTFASDKRIPYNPEHTIGGNFVFSWITKSKKKGSFLISGHYESLRYINRSNNAVLKSYFLLNVGVNQEISKNLTMFGTLRNMLNETYELYSDYPLPGITMTLGLRMNFDRRRKDD